GSTQFFEFLSQIVEAGAEGDGVRLSTGLIQFVAADDVAATVAELAIGAPAGGHVELGGPEALGIDAWGRRLFAATGDNRAVIADPARAVLRHGAARRRADAGRGGPHREGRLRHVVRRKPAGGPLIATPPRSGPHSWRQEYQLAQTDGPAPRGK